MNIFDLEDYKTYLAQQIDANQNTRGYKTQLAKAAGCQKPYISQVLTSHIHLTPEHAMGLALFWNLSEVEREYWLELVHLGRTQFAPLRNRILNRLETLKKERDDFSKRFKEKVLQDHEAQSLYYSDWHYPALHMLVQIEGFQTLSTISKRLNIPAEIVTEKMYDLENLGLIRKADGHYLSTQNNIHLPKDSIFNLVSHQNWRARALVDVQNKKTDGLHYSAIQTLSKDDFLKLKNKILKFIDEQRSIITPSTPEELVCFNCDWFRV